LRLSLLRGSVILFGRMFRVSLSLSSSRAIQSQRNRTE
jgi:type III secretory pathway component EscV